MKAQSQKKEIRVLLIEDDISYRTLISSILRKADIHCTLCSNGDQAAKKLSQEKYDLIIADYLLPGNNGIEIVKWARVNKVGTPALIITNFPSEELLNKIKAINQTQLIAKSTFNPLDMVNVVQRSVIL